MKQRTENNMFIHLGEDVVIRTEEVIAIFNYGIFLEEELNQAFIKNMIENKKLLDVSGEQSKSVVITKKCIYYSQFSPTTLKKRSLKSF